MTKHNGVLPVKELEKARGYLVYTTRTYPGMVPYLKGIHLTLDSWREGRDKDVWKTSSTNSQHQEELQLRPDDDQLEDIKIETAV